jgi:RNA polymerase sigma-70 factor (ECF subfamily)
MRARVVSIDGQPGLAVFSGSDVRVAMVFSVAGDHIVHYDVIADPQRLAVLHIEA